jgi:hypothetical protein
MTRFVHVKEVRGGYSISFYREEPSPYGGVHPFCYANYEVGELRGLRFIQRCIKRGHLY